MGISSGEADVISCMSHANESMYVIECGSIIVIIPVLRVIISRNITMKNTNIFVIKIKPSFCI